MKQLNITNILKILKDSTRVILGMTLICVLIAFVLAYFFIDPVYTATATLYANNDTSRTSGSSDRITLEDISASQKLVNTCSIIIKSDTVLNRVIKVVNDDYPDVALTPSGIRGRMLSIKSVDQTEAFTVSVTTRNPDISKTMADAIVDIAPNAVVDVLKIGGLEVIDPAVVDTSGTKPVVKYVAIGFGIGLLGSVFFILLRAFSDHRIYSEDELRQYFKVPVLGVIPAMALNLPDNGEGGHPHEMDLGRSEANEAGSAQDEGGKLESEPETDTGKDEEKVPPREEG